MFEGDQHDVHPKQFCFNCYRSMLLCQERKYFLILHNFQTVLSHGRHTTLILRNAQHVKVMKQLVAKGGRPRSKVAKLAPGIRGTMGTQHCHEIIESSNTEEQADTFTDKPPTV